MDYYSEDHKMFRRAFIKFVENEHSPHIETREVLQEAGFTDEEIKVYEQAGPGE